MRYLVISDIHANLVALEAVLQDAPAGWQQIWCLGDVVGYGPNPNECVERLNEYDHLCLSGNHDWAVLGKLDINYFNNEARTAIRWTQDVLSSENRQYLSALAPLTIVEPFTLVHASPRQPVWEYLLDEVIVAQNMALLQTHYCFAGHTHAPVIFTEMATDDIRAAFPAPGETLQLGEKRVIINPGSVGQPRDSDPRAAYGILDTEGLTWEYHRVAYDVAETQQRMRQHGLPHRLIARLELGW